MSQKIEIGTKYIIVDNEEKDEDGEITYCISNISMWEGEKWATIEYYQYGTEMDDSIKLSSLEKSFEKGEYKLI